MEKYLDIVFDLPLEQSFSYRCDEKGEAAIGKRVMTPFGRRELLGYVIAEHYEAPALVAAEKIKAVRRVVDKEPIFDQADIDLSKWMSMYYLCSHGEALSAMIPSGRRAGSYSAFSDGFDDSIADNINSSINLALSAEQEQAIKKIQILAKAANKNKKENAGPSMAYLYGITGSGKTEVFLRLAELMHQSGLSVLYLVPEISLTHQLTELIGKRFGAIAATLHSGMTGSERLNEWMRIRRGEVKIAIGPRSAVFAPLRNLGLIIIDEEHDSSYKSGNTPRYHARQIAMRRSANEGALLLMGSATPSVEAWKLMQDGIIPRFSLNRRLSGGKLPDIIPVNIGNTPGCLSTELKEEIRNTFRMGRQTILFLNRRGFSYFYHCKICNYELSCKRCSVSLTYHKSKNKALCHYCGYEIPPPLSCPQCGSLEAGFSGFGTEYIEEEVRSTFPELRTLRADADTTGKKGSLKQMLQSFKNGEIDLLLGTQMVAKGLNFPGVRLVGVVFADTGLQLPDFRAAERTFSLIVQVAGRAGRYFPDGKVIVQTLRPGDPAIKSACTLDMEGFYQSELQQRCILNFPPYSRLIRIVVRSRKKEKADEAINRLFSLAMALLQSNVEILGPAECPIGIQNNNFRRQLLFRGQSLGPLHNALQAVLRQYETEKEPAVYLEIDVDPVQLL